MSKNQGLTTWIAVCALSSLGATASRAQSAPPLQVESVELVKTIKPSAGFIDDPFSFDRAGSRLLYVNSDSGTSAQIIVLDTFQRTELRRVDLKKFTTKPSKVEFALDGEHYLVWSRHAKSGEQVVGLIDGKGRVLRTFGPATDLVRTNYDGQDAISVHQVRAIAAKKKRAKSEGDPVVRHTVGVYAVSSRKLLGKKTELDLGRDDKSTKLDFTLKYWSEDFTVAVGLKGGEWDQQENQRSPDFEGHYEMPTRTFSKRLPIANIVKHHERMARLSKYAKRSKDVVVKRNLSGVDFVSEGTFTAIDLSEPFHHYDPRSLVAQQAGSGRIFFSIEIDPVHPDAAAKRRAVKPWTELYEYSMSTGKASLRARMLAKKGRKYAWRANQSHWAVMPRHIGFDRGGSELLIYKLK